MRRLATTNGVYDFYLVTFLQAMLGIACAWHNLLVHFHGQTLACQLEAGHQFLCGVIIGDLPWFTIELDVHGEKSLAGRVSVVNRLLSRVKKV